MRLWRKLFPKDIQALIRTSSNYGYEAKIFHVKNPVLFDGRNQYEAGQMKELGFEYYQIGVGKQRKCKKDGFKIS